MGVNFARRWQHLRESVEALRKLRSGDDVSYAGEIVKFPPKSSGPSRYKSRVRQILLGAHDPKYALKRVARYADGWCPGGLSAEKARERIPQIKKMAKEFGRDPDRLRVLAPLGAEGPSADVMKQYREVGVTRLVVAASAVSEDGVKVVRGLGSVVELAAKL